MLMLSTTLGRLLTTARQKYQVYLSRTESTYRATHRPDWNPRWESWCGVGPPTGRKDLWRIII